MPGEKKVKSDLSAWMIVSMDERCCEPEPKVYSRVRGRTWWEDHRWSTLMINIRNAVKQLPERAFEIFARRGNAEGQPSMKMRRWLGTARLVIAEFN